MRFAWRWLAAPDDAPATEKSPSLVLLGAAWLLLFAVQALVRPVDGFVLEHVRTPGVAWLSGPLGAALLTWLAPGQWIGYDTWRHLYIVLLVAVPAASAWWIARGCSDAAWSRRTRLALVAIVSVLWVAAIADLPYLSNDLYLYRAHGQMLSHFSASPYTASPAQVIDDETLRNVPWIRQRSPYGPLALSGFRLATSGWPSGMAADFLRLKLLLGLPLLLLPAVLLACQRLDPRMRLAGAAWIGLNPLLILEIGQNGHLDGWVGLLLAWTVLVLTRPATPVRVAQGAILCGLACALKLSLLAVIPVVAAWVWLRGGTRFSRAALARLGLYGLVFIATLVVAYLPFWHGADTFTGLRQESAKIIRSFYSVLAHLLGVHPLWLLRGERVANLAAVASGLWLAIRHGNLAAGLLGTLLIQALVGRTFVQPWHFCPALMLVPFVSLPAHEPDAVEARGARWMDQRLLLLVLLTLSVSLLAGGYALLLGSESRANVRQTLSYLGMVLPPLAVLAGAAAIRWRGARRPGRADQSHGPDIAHPL